MEQQAEALILTELPENVSVLETQEPEQLLKELATTG